VLNHAEKEKVLWEAFKDRLGQSDFTAMSFNLNFFLQATSELAWLDDSFAKEEIDSIVKHLPNDKAPGPDGFDNEFIKRCWHCIKEEFYELCFAFQENAVCLQGINDSYITLIPKLMGPCRWDNSGQYLF
jgi:hypothetical protein